jgi:hypothetical protein
MGGGGRTLLYLGVPEQVLELPVLLQQAKHAGQLSLGQPAQQQGIFNLFPVNRQCNISYASVGHRVCNTVKEQQKKLAKPL